METKELEKKFVKLSYKEISKVLDILGTHFAEPIETISKGDIFSTIDYDYSNEQIKKAMESIRRA